MGLFLLSSSFESRLAAVVCAVVLDPESWVAYVSTGTTVLTFEACKLHSLSLLR